MTKTLPRNHLRGIASRQLLASQEDISVPTKLAMGASQIERLCDRLGAKIGAAEDMQWSLVMLRAYLAHERSRLKSTSLSSLSVLVHPLITRPRPL